MHLSWNLNSFTLSKNHRVPHFTKNTLLDQLKIGNRIVCINESPTDRFLIQLPTCYVRSIDIHTIQIWLTNDERIRFLERLTK